MDSHIKFFRDYAAHNCFLSSVETAVVYCSCNMCRKSIQAHSFTLISDFLIFLAEKFRKPLLSCWNMHLKKDSVSLRLLFSLHHCWAKLLSNISTQQTNVLTCTLAKYIHTHESEPRFLTTIQRAHLQNARYNFRPTSPTDAVYNPNQRWSGSPAVTHHTTDAMVLYED